MADSGIKSFGKAFATAAVGIVLAPFTGGASAALAFPVVVGHGCNFVHKILQDKVESSKGSDADLKEGLMEGAVFGLVTNASRAVPKEYSFFKSIYRMTSRRALLSTNR